MSKDDDHSEYKVGRNRPPRNTRWKAGTSGNPSGRPKGRHRLTSIEDMLSSPAIVTRNGKPVKIDTRTAVLVRIKNLAANGDRAMLKMLEPYLKAPQPSDEEKLWQQYRDTDILINYFDGQGNPLKKTSDDSKK